MVTTNDSGPLLLTINQAGARLGLSRSSIYELIDTGKLPRIKYGFAARIHARDVERVAEELRAQAVAAHTGESS